MKMVTDDLQGFKRKQISKYQSNIREKQLLRTTQNHLNWLHKLLLIRVFALVSDKFSVGLFVFYVE